jgi:hypothetical protein
VPISFPGSDYWQVEILRDYSKDWPALTRTEDGWRFRPGFLSPVADPKLAPFFVYKGIEHVRPVLFPSRPSLPSRRRSV